MTSYVITSNINASAGDGQLMNDNDTLFLAPGVLITASNDGVGTTSDASGTELQVFGTIAADGAGIGLNGTLVYITVGASGSVAGIGDGIFVESDFQIVNAGTIAGGLEGIQAEAGGQIITNSGLIVGADSAIYLSDNGIADADTIDNSGTLTAYRGINQSSVGEADITNSGTISAGYGIILDSNATMPDTVVNSGAINASVSGIDQMGSGNTTVLNTGTIAGGIVFGAGNDIYDGADGHVAGTVVGGDGNDTLAGGSGIDVFSGGNGNDVMMGGGGNDRFSSGGGTDVINGGSGNDTIIMDKGLSTGDQIDGGSGRDTLLLDGDYSSGFVFAPSTMVNVETILLENGFGYNLTTDDATVAAGQTLTVDATRLSGGATLFFNGSAETDGHFNILAGASGSSMTGGNLSDTLHGGAGIDNFVYLDPSESTGVNFDEVVAFDVSADKFNMDVTVSAIDPEVTSGRLTTANLDGTLAAAIGSSQLAAGHAVLFTPTIGNLKGDTFLIVDANGVAGYQAGQDYVIELVSPLHLPNLSTGNFT